MIRHLIRLMWNRKRQNLLVFAEIFCAFLVVVTVAVLATWFGRNAMRPLGFQIERVWMMDIDPHRGNGPAGSGPSPEDDRATTRRMEAAIGSLPGVEVASGAFTGPYRGHSWGQGFDLEDGRHLDDIQANRVDDRYGEVFAIPVVAGRWFSRDDDGVAWDPVIVNRALARMAFGDANPIGRDLVERRNPNDLAPHPIRRVVGLIDDFRQFGELAIPVPVIIYRATLDAAPDRLQLPEALYVKVRPGTPAAFEEVLVKTATAIAPDRSITVTAVAAQRDEMLQQDLVPLTVVAIVAGSMLLMVALGLTGVVWQTVTQRIREFGLRRAQGATARDVRTQVVAELLVMTSFAIAAGLVVLAQVPFLPLPRDLMVVPRPIVLAGVLMAIAVVYLVTVVCAWYPSRLAARVPPAEALHYE